MERQEQIYLCGFMGAGKSFELHRFQSSCPQTTFRLIDLDDFILKQCGHTSIESLVQQKGWDFFRTKEDEVLRAFLHTSQRMVVALGGGSLNQTLAHLLNSQAYLLWLETPLETCLERIFRAEEQQKRPLALKGREFLVQLYEDRKELYSISSFRMGPEIMKKFNSPEDLLAHIKN